jgi:hypothetical protein
MNSFTVVHKGLRLLDSDVILRHYNCIGYIVLNDMMKRMIMNGESVTTENAVDVCFRAHLPTETRETIEYHLLE